MLLRRLIYVRNQTVSYFDSMTGFGRLLTIRKQKFAHFQWLLWRSCDYFCNFDKLMLRGARNVLD
jgi:hypothetical protein